MKTNFKKHWKTVVAFAVGGAMCLGMGVFVFANQGTQTQLDDQPQLLLQSADGLNNNGGNAKNGIITVSEWSETGVYGTSGSSSSSTSSNIWESINNKAVYGTANIHTVTLSITTNDGTYSIPIKVAHGASCSASGNVLTISGVDFTAPAAASNYECTWKMNNTTVPATITSDYTATASYEYLWYAALDATMGGTYSGTSDTPDTTNYPTIAYTAFTNYKWVTFESNPTANSIRWIIIGEAHNSGYSGSWYVPDSSNNGIASARITATSTTELTDGQILLFKEKTADIKSVYDNTTDNGGNKKACWGANSTYGYTSTIKTKLNTTSSDVFAKLGLTADFYNNNIVTKTMKTAWSPNSSSSSTVCVEESSGSKIFLLATTEYYGSTLTYTGYSTQNFCAQTYLGSATTTSNSTPSGAPKYYKWSCDGSSGAGSSSYWWLRSGLYDFNDSAYRVYYGGGVSACTVDFSSGVRPAFVLNI